MMLVTGLSRAHTPSCAARCSQPVRAADTRPAATPASFGLRGPRALRVLQRPASTATTPVHIVVGSQGGTGAMFAKLLEGQLKASGVEAVTTTNMEEFDGKTLPNLFGPAVFISSNFGKGLPPASAASFFNTVLNDETELNGLHYAVFGLGHSDCATLWGGQYQAAGRKLDMRLKTRNAHPLLPRGEGDDKFDIEEEWETWQNKLVPVLIHHIEELPESPAGASAAAAAAAVPSAQASTADMGSLVGWTVPLQPSAPADFQHLDKHPPFSLDNAATVRLNRNVELCAPGWDRHCSHLEFKMPEGMTYETGDYLGIYPENSEEVSAHTARAFGFTKRDVFETALARTRVGSVRLPPMVPAWCTMRRLLRSYTDLQLPPKRQQLRWMADKSPDAEEAKQLAALAKMDRASDEFKKLCYDRTLPCFMEEYAPKLLQAMQNNVAAFLEMTIPMKARYYSISSSAKHHLPEGAVHLTVHSTSWVMNDGAFSCTERVVTKPTPVPKPMPIVVSSSERSALCSRSGSVCSTFLRMLGPQDAARVWVEKSAFKLPHSDDVPIIMIGVGSGIAPFLGFIQERLGRAPTITPHTGAPPKIAPKPYAPGARQNSKNWLIYGCRHPVDDFLYADVLREYEATGNLVIDTAFSHVDPDTGAFDPNLARDKQTYVQHVLREHGAEVWSLLNEKGASLLVCGHLACGQGVEQAVRELAMKHGGMTAAQAGEYRDMLRQSDRYHLDVFGNTPL